MLSDSDTAFRLLLGSLIEGDGRFELVGQSALGADAIRWGHTADVVVLDLVLDDGDAFATIDHLRALEPAPTIVVLAVVDPPYLRAEASARGVAAYLTKDAHPAAVLDALVEAARPDGASSLPS